MGLLRLTTIICDSSVRKTHQKWKVTVCQVHFRCNGNEREFIDCNTIMITDEVPLRGM
jgi:hypothetical protein